MLELLWVVLNLFYFFVSVFVFFETQREREREREREEGERNLKQAAHLAWSPMRDSISQLWDHDLSQNQELDTQSTEPPRCPMLFLKVSSSPNVGLELTTLRSRAMYSIK